MIDNNKVSNIPCRLHNVGEGGVAGADEVIDDNKGKSQQQINAEVDQILGEGGSVDERISAAVNVEETRAEGAESALDSRVDTLEEAVGTGGSIDSRIASAVAPKANSADVYTKTETYNKTEVNGLVSTPHQNYVTVATYASLPASGSTDTIYRVSSYDGANSQVDDTVYSEYAWDGTQYVFLCVKSQIEEVFDITVYNNNTKYADLAAALGVDGANIPSSLRRGGMSVKYVQSSDNKYVQYRYMGTETTGSPNPFLDTTNWINIDEEVENLEARVSTIETELFGWNADFTKNVERGTINKQGKWTIDGDNYTHVAIPIDSNSVPKIDIKSKETTAARYVFLKSYSVPQVNDSVDFCNGFNDLVFISPNTLVENIDVPSDAHYVCFLIRNYTVYNTPEYAKSKNSLNNTIVELSEEVSDISDSVEELQEQFNNIEDFVEEEVARATEEKVEIDFSTNDGYYINNGSGGLVSSSSYTTSDFISVKEGDKIEYDGYTSGNARSCWGYDVADDNTQNKSELLGNVTGKASVTVPSGVNYIRVCSRKTDPGTGTAIDYSAYYLVNKYATNELLENSVSAVKQEMDTYQFGELNMDFDFSNVLPNYTFPQRLNTCAELYQLWDALVTDNPTYITKVDASTETGITKPAYVTTPVYVYKFIPKVDNTNTTRKLKVLLYSGEHSGEWAGLYFLKDFMKWICDNWRINKDCEILRTMVDFYVIPCLNVWGYDNMGIVAGAGRLNYNGVNINRNYPASNWTLTEQGLDYSGPSAGSEYETQVIMWYVENIKPDIMLSIHTGATGSSGNTNVIDLSINDEKQNTVDFEKLFGIICRTSANRMTIDDSNYPQNLNQVLVGCGIYKESDIVAKRTAPYTGLCHMYAMEKGVPLSMLVEMCSHSLWENGVHVESGGEEGTNLLGMCQMRFLCNLICRAIHAISKSAYR